MRNAVTKAHRRRDEIYGCCDPVDRVLLEVSWGAAIRVPFEKKEASLDGFSSGRSVSVGEIYGGVEGSLNGSRAYARELAVRRACLDSATRAGPEQAGRGSSTLRCPRAHR